MRVAAVDCGTNTVKLLVADLDPETGSEVELVREARMVRLGQGVDRTGELAAEALARLFAAVDEYAALVAEHDVGAVRFCATSAARDARNAEVFLSGVEERLGVRPEIIAGAEEARLSFDGATRGLGDRPAPLLVVDIGGGSTELVLGSAHGRVEAGHSLDIGSVRMTERHLHGDPPSSAEVEAAAAQVEAALDTLPGAGVDLARTATAVAVSGTGLTVAAAVLGLPRFDREVLHHAVVPAEGVHDATAMLLGMTVEERRALPYMHPGRADVIGAGALILDRVLQHAGVDELRVSVSDILDGIAWSLV
ncbi:Ppx/GppA phosphatase family protein [Nocardioides caldifontis]|uniref:Ppx/GppA phosphatase family protein n=1 Tax=Nocardioides caldifontis TaxID=2588938 RepID=UPI0011E03F7F|nr:Ppx/GppA phosphatase family protein [Nocardioides caldifontis]